VTVWIEITSEANAAIRAAALGQYRQKGMKQPNGNWLIPVDLEVRRMLKRKAFPGESYSDTILRLIANEKGLQ